MGRKQRILYLLIDKLTPEFLFFVWQQLKFENFTNNFGCSYFRIPPISKAWFFKISFLIRSNRVFYKRFISSVDREITISNSKSCIIQSAFFSILKPFFDEYLSFNTSYFSEYFVLFSTTMWYIVI